MDKSKFKSGTGWNTVYWKPSYRYYTTTRLAPWHIVEEDDSEIIYACCDHSVSTNVESIEFFIPNRTPMMADVCASCMLAIIIGYSEPELVMED